MLSRIFSSLNQQIIKHGIAEIHTSSTLEAARKGTRLKREAIKRAMKRKKIEVAKKEFIPANKRKELEKLKLLKTRPGPTEEPTDNVYIVHYFKPKIYTVSEAMVHHRQICHPTSFNQPDALVSVFIEMSMKLDNKNRYIPAFSGMLNMPNKFEANEEERHFLVITDDHKVSEEVQALGVENVVGSDVGKLIKTNKINLDDFTHVICDVQLMPELSGLRPVFRKKFPNVAEGTAVVDVPESVKKFQTGVEYAIIKSKYDPNYATLDAKIGRISMSDFELEQNLALLLRDVSGRQPKTRTKSMIDKVQLKSEPCLENVLIDHTKFLMKSV